MTRKKKKKQTNYISISLQYLCKGGYSCILRCPDLTQGQLIICHLCVHHYRELIIFKIPIKLILLIFDQKISATSTARILTATLTSINSRSHKNQCFKLYSWLYVENVRKNWKNIEQSIYFHV